MENDLPIPLSDDERKALTAKAAAGEIPTLEICRRFIATIRKSLAAAPKRTEKGNKSRNKKAETSEDDIKDFF